jgi:predicted nucleotidyltransferase
MAERRLTALVRALHDAGIEFVVVGGLSATLNGVPINTFDVDVVHRRTSENIDRILPVLEALDAVYRIQPERRLRPVRSALLSTGHQNLLTKHGPLDLLGEIGNGLGYEELVPRSKEILIAEGLRVRILNLETLIEVKEQLNGEKDRAMLLILRRTLEEKKHNRNPHKP